MAELTPTLQLQPRLGLSQTISPQMQQSLHILQAPILELRTMIEQEMQQNPLLEEKDPPVESSFESFNSINPSPLPTTQSTRERGDWEERDPWEHTNSLLSQDEAKRRHDYLLESMTRPSSLREHLLEQLSISGASKPEKRAAEEIIGSLDEHGFLPISLEEISSHANVPEKTAQKALELVQSFHPLGIGARSLKESLLIQLNQRGKRNDVESRIVSENFELLAKKDVAQIAKLTKTTEERVRQALEYITHLQPRPASGFSADKPEEIIQPEASFVPIDGTWGVQMSKGQIPQLKISDRYKDMLYESSQPADLRAYLKEKMTQARGLISAIEQREETLHRILTELARHQASFLEKGPQALRPLTLRPIAETLNLHEATISRAVAHKYVETPWGIWPLRKFFSSGYRTDQGEEISNLAVQKTIQELVKQEDARKPYSDTQIVKKLAENGIHIARRTVAKYRDALGILPTHLRRKR